MGNDPKAFAKASIQALQDALSKANMKYLGEFAADMIRLRTRLGYGVKKTGAEKETLKPLSPNYIQQRKDQNNGAGDAIRGVSKKSRGFKTARHHAGGLSPLTTPAKSNLTRTGQLLDSLGVTKVEQGSVTIGASGARDDGENNKDVAGYVSKKRPFNNLSGTESKRLNDEFKRLIKAAIAKRLTK